MNTEPSRARVLQEFGRTECPEVLLYCEPQPIRNTFTEFAHIARLLTPVLMKLSAKKKIRLRVFGNNDTVDVLLRDVPNASFHLQRPTASENRYIESRHQQWNSAAIQDWLALVKGEGRDHDFYRAVLERLHSVRPIDLVLCWSENGAVRQFAAQKGIPMLYCELGPTRQPFAETVYFDRTGTNGNALIRKLARQLLDSGEGAVAEHYAGTWLLPSERLNANAETRYSLLDAPLYFHPEHQAKIPESPYVYISLQLADDLNTLVHSDYGSPKDFLASVIPMVRDLGYEAVVKGHPGAVTRPYNLLHEVDALEFVTEEYPGTVILPRQASADFTHYAMCRAAYTLSINSSQSFESLLLGVPTILCGRAMFDADGWLQENITLQPAGDRADYAHEIDRLTSCYLGNFLVPKEVALTAEYLSELIHGELARGPALPTADPYTDWYTLGMKNGPPQAPSSNLLGGPPPAPGAKLSSEQDRLVFANPDGTRLHLEKSKDIIGFLDKVDVTRDEKSAKTMLSGWALDATGLRPAAAVIMLVDNAVTSAHRLVQPRLDVASSTKGYSGSGLCGFRFEISGALTSRHSLVVVSADGCGKHVANLEPGRSFSAIASAA